LKQILQSLENGETQVVEIPAPLVRAGQLLIQTCASVVSVGTERMLVDFGKANLLQKARSQPERVKEVLAKIRTDGLAPTLTAIRSKLGQPIPLGYSNAGVVLAVGKGVNGFAVGDRVISNGQHAEIISVPANLCAKIPDSTTPIPFSHAAFTVIAAIGLQGVRLARPTLGERFVVIGLGLIGLLTVQILRANGCEVLGIDVNPARLALAQRFGAKTVNLSAGENPLEVAAIFSEARGVDGVIITASTKSSDPVHQAAQMSRQRGRIILVGVTGLELSRADFYEKELTFQVSCSYGPGRYDENYESKGIDYPFGFVRWTEQRNFEAVLSLIAQGQLQLEPIISHQFEFNKAKEAYDLVSSGSNVLGIVLEYDQRLVKLDSTITLTSNVSSIAKPSSPVVGIIGAGNYTAQVFMPALKLTQANLAVIASSGGFSAVHLGKKFQISRATTDASSVFQDPQVNTVLITTRHDSHAKYVIKALRANKHVFVEKPIAIRRDELEEIEQVYNELRSKGIAPLVGIGFNRRFAPQVIKMKSLLNSVQDSKTLIMTVNAGFIPANHWTQDTDIGGGRIIGEACHFVDLLRFLAGQPITRVSAVCAENAQGKIEDRMTINLSFADGTIGTVHYLANGHKSFPKERLDVFAGGRVLHLDNFRRLIGYGWAGFRSLNLASQNKGHAANIASFINAIAKGEVAPIPFEEIIEVTKACFDAVESAGLKNGSG
jgi:predicted dehydrogenase/threonine dehydrogenase-like Zn-dependent dehydrogenase